MEVSEACAASCRPTLAQCGSPDVGVDCYSADITNYAGLKLSKNAATNVRRSPSSKCWDGQTHCYSQYWYQEERRWCLSAVVSALQMVVIAAIPGEQLAVRVGPTVNLGTRMQGPSL
ncbi:hypothetical protein GQ600_26793 [Phytophthora cactorum]|nr:hypothetical protein GQ600_26793 [Phytophthora cactorum]